MWRRCAVVATILAPFALPQVLSAKVEEWPPIEHVINGVPTEDFPTVGALGIFDALGHLSLCASSTNTASSTT